MSRLSENPITSQTPEIGGTGPEFTSEQRHLLLGIARAAIASGLAGQPLPGLASASSSSASSSSSSSWPGLMEPRGVFTTLYLGDRLRGCVGYALPIRPLYLAVGETARAAAFEDSRFWPVTTEEAGELRISLSVLSRLFPIAPVQVEVGRHGLLISDGARRGLLLPQVPLEHGWDRETFLDQTCRKAGLPLDTWRRPGVDIQAFIADVFGDEGIPQ